MKDDKYYLEQAYLEAMKAEQIDEVPIGCVIVLNDEIIARGYNQREKNKSVISHAEIEAMKKASEKLNSWRLDNCEVYVTLEPCLMCASALQQAHVKRIIYGAKSLKTGALGTFFDINSLSNLNHYPLVSYLPDEKCSLIISNYFRKKR